MSDFEPFTDEDVRKHRILIDARQRAENAARAENYRQEHPRTLADWAQENDICDSPPIVERPSKGPLRTEDE
jgi:hypothetical protein